MVDAFATANDMVLEQYKTDTKPNEITVIPERLKILEIMGCLITVDAMEDQTEIASTFVKSNANYLLSVKNN